MQSDSFYLVMEGRPQRMMMTGRWPICQPDYTRDDSRKIIVTLWTIFENQPQSSSCLDAAEVATDACWCIFIKEIDHIKIILPPTSPINLHLYKKNDVTPDANRNWISTSLISSRVAKRATGNEEMWWVAIVQKCSTILICSLMYLCHNLCKQYP